MKTTWISALSLFGMLAAVRGAQSVPPSCSPALERAAAALAEGKLDAARDGFEAVAGDEAAPAFVRELARRGAAEASRPRAETPARDPAAYRVGLPALPEPAAIFHVAPDGGEGGDGSAPHPFGSIEKARDAVRALKEANGGKLPPGGARILIRGGAYPVRRTLALGPEDSGAARSPVVYMAAPGGTPILDGGVRIRSWRPVSDAGIRERLDPAIRDRVFEADLAALGVDDLGDATDLRRAPELFCDGAPQTLARWPNEGFIKTGEVFGKEPRFRYIEDRPSRWVDEPDVRLYGYWFWDWYEEFQKVASMDAREKTFTLSRPYAQYGYRKDQRYYALNILREIDRPGEWYLDRRKASVYWLPPEGVDPSEAEATLSVFAQPSIALAGVEHVIILGLEIRDGRGDGIHIRDGARCLVAGCTVRRMGGDAIVIQGGEGHAVFGCLLERLGCGGTRVAGGDRKTLAPGGHTVENNHVRDISRRKRTYAPAVHLDGCGNRVAHNLFERIPSSAMRIEGNDHVIELNRIRNVVEESDDQGGLDMFGNPLYRGVVIRWNHWCDIVGGTHCGAAGVRLDDMISGIAVRGNVFERCGAVLFGGVQIHGGKDNRIDNNLFLDCFAGISFSRWGEKRWLDAIARFLAQAGEAPYATRYPDLARIRTGADVNLISRNVFSRTKEVFLRDGGVAKTALNAAVDRPIDPKGLSDEGAVHADPMLARILFEPIPFGEIGPYEHPWRVKDEAEGP
ncbi:MAG: right-handed parallel beta-helix repeat-containing protein [Planctomycetes bacterium]|nr:right-handed parallel beta-helix repeat-containing protein [Planctomycetota bacterium]